MTVQIQDTSLASIQKAINDLYTLVKPLKSGVLDMSGRRVINAGKPIDSFDYVRKFDLDTLAAAHKTTVNAMRQSLLRILGPIRVGVFASRGSPIGHNQQLFIASDHNYVAWVSDGLAWHWQSGENVATQSGIAAITAVLTLNDGGYILNVSDFTHRLQWSGSAWAFAEGDDGSGFVGSFGITPTGGTWGICDGSAYTYLKGDGTTASYTTIDTNSLGLKNADLTDYFRR